MEVETKGSIELIQKYATEHNPEPVPVTYHPPNPLFLLNPF